MKAARLFVAAAFSAAASLSLCARSYIAERGDTWESIARKWGVHTDELKAANPFFSEIYMGVEVDLPENSAAEPLSNYRIAQYATDDINIEKAEKALADGNYTTARSLLSSSMHRRNHTTARLYCLYASACEGSSDYVSALENYSNAATLFNNGDRTMSQEQTTALNSRMERLVPLATEQKKQEAEAQRRRDELAAAQRRRDEEKKERRRNFWNNLGMGILQGLAATAQGYGGYNQGWSMTPAQTPVSLAPTFTPTYTPVTFPLINWADFSNISWDNTPVYTNFTPSFGWDTAPAIIDGGGFDNSDTLSGSGTTSGGEVEYEYSDCTVCNGTGWMVNNSTVTMGQTGTKYCDICRKTVDLSHGHQRCPSCQGGKQKRRVR